MPPQSVSSASSSIRSIQASGALRSQFAPVIDLVANAESSMWVAGRWLATRYSSVCCTALRSRQWKNAWVATIQNLTLYQDMHVLTARVK